MLKASWLIFLAASRTNDVIAEGVVQAAKDINLEVPLVVRLEGTKVDEEKAIINGSGLNVIAANDLDDAAQKIVTAVKG